MKYKSALLDNDGKVIGEVYDSPFHGNAIEVAEKFSEEGLPLNTKYYKISRSKQNMAKAAFEQPLIRKGDVWTFHHVDF